MKRLLLLRPGAFLMSGMVTLVGYKMNTGLNYESLIATFLVIFGTIATVVHDDLLDFEHDKKRGQNKNDESKAFLRTVSICTWLATIGLTIYLSVLAVETIFVALPMILIGFFYGYTKKIPYGAAFFVALAASLPTLFSASRGLHKLEVWVLSMAVFVFAYAKEILKDLDDIEIDQGYKLTIPIRWGEINSRLLASYLFAVTALIGVRFNNTAASILLGVGCVVTFLLLQLTPVSQKIIKVFVDVFASFALLAILLL